MYLYPHDILILVGFLDRFGWLKAFNTVMCLDLKKKNYPLVN